MWRSVATASPKSRRTFASRPSRRLAIDVSGLLVTPGLIDIHVHVYHTREPETLSIIADHHAFRSGVTTVVDTGTAGAKHFLHFKRTVIDRWKTRIFAFINIVKSGMQGPFEQDVSEMDPELAASVLCSPTPTTASASRPRTTGWRSRLMTRTRLGLPSIARWKPRRYLRQAADGRFLASRRDAPTRSLLRKMQPGDIHTHVYAQQFPILDDANKPADFMFEARERGIIFDLGHGAGSFWFRQAIPAFDGGFPPDSISTDLHIGNVNGVVHDMLNTMSKLLCMGMPPERCHQALHNRAGAGDRP